MRRTDYQQIAGTYDSTEIRRQIEPDTDLVQQLKACAEQDSVNVLDLACGTGSYLLAQSQRFAKQPINWHGLDASSAMLAQARPKLPNSITLSEGRAETMPYEAARFDYITSRFAFHHFEDKEAALDEVARVLAPGGSFRIFNISPELMERWWVYRFFPAGRQHDRQRFWEAHQLYRGLLSRGLEPELRVDFRIRQVDLDEVLEEARKRNLSQLAIIDDADFQAGLKAMEQRRDATSPEPLLDEIALLSCCARRPG